MRRRGQVLTLVNRSEALAMLASFGLVCSRCDGTGRDPRTGRVCPKCKGTGR